MRWISGLVAIAALLTVATGSYAKTWSVPEASSLAEAFESYADGDTIALAPGKHPAKIDVQEERGFVLIGDDRETTFLIGLDDIEPILRIDARRSPVVLKNLTFDRQQEGSVYTTIITRAQLTVDNCSFWGGAASLVDSCEGVWSNCDFQGCFDGINLRNSPMVVEHNIFENTQQYAIITRGSEAKIYNNQFNKTAQASIIVTGKRRYPVIGGAPGKGNIFLQHPMYTIANQSRNELNARHNYWGATVTSTMQELGYPADISSLFDYWDGEDRATGMVDFQDWASSPEEALKGAGVSIPGSRIPLIPALAGVVLAIIIISVMRRKRA